jgi:K+-sensing histidine kinase KdpD
VINTLSSTLKPNVSIHSQIDYNLAPVKGDAQRVSQILFNLAGNAIKFTAKGSVVITAGVLHDSNMVAISVRDTGIGLAPDELDKVFLPFMQGKCPYCGVCFCFVVGLAQGELETIFGPLLQVCACIVCLFFRARARRKL